MRASQMTSMCGRAAGALGLGGLLFVYGCGAPQNAAGVRAQSLEQTGAPVLVTCEPTQRTLVRQAIVNGAAVSQVECVTVAPQVAYGDAYAPGQTSQLVPVSYTYPASRAAVRPIEDLGDARIVRAPATYPVAGARPVQARQVVYQEPRRAEVVRRGRSVKKSAIIIGSSAGVGAGVGAAVGGKKGALIGAAISGGAAAIWDQLTRRQQ